MYDKEVDRIAEQIVWMSRMYRKPVGEILQDCFNATGKPRPDIQTQLIGWVD